MIPGLWVMCALCVGEMMRDSEEPRVRGGYAIVSVHDTASSEWDVGSGGCGVKKDRSRGFVAREAEAYVVNASRGGTVDTAALVDALHFDDLEKISMVMTAQNRFVKKIHAGARPGGICWRDFRPSYPAHLL